MSKNVINNDSLKEYYLKLQGLYENALNMLTAINSSLSTNASEITIDVADSDDSSTTVRIPSFLYLESKLEQLENNFGNLFKMPKSGEAWFNKSSGMYKLQMVRSNTAPAVPDFNADNNLYAAIRDNNILKDLVSPKTYLKLNVSNVPENIESMFMRKIVIFSQSLFNSLQVMNLNSYDDYKAALFNYVKGKDYEEYDSTLKMPTRKDTYKSQFNIVEIPEQEAGNPWVDGDSTSLSYKLRLDTLQYFDQEDSSISFTLKTGDLICLGNEMAIYKIKNVDTASNTIIIEENVGHIALQTTEENSSMTFQLYNDNYAQYSYVEIPLEENQYICVFIGSIYNNVRSILSKPLLVDLSKIYIKDAGGNYILDSYGNKYSYMSYYKQFCINIGDLILGLTQSAYPQISNYNAAQLNDLQNNEDIRALINTTVNSETILKVVPINKHLTNDQGAEEIKNLHAQKNDINAQIVTVQGNINQVYNQLTTTDFSQETSVTQDSLNSQIQKYYTERTTLEKQLNAVIDSINAKTAELSNIGNEIKYRIRGIAEIDSLEQYVKKIGDAKCDIIAMDVEYKYKSTAKDTSTVTVINSSTFTDWNKLNNIERARHLVFDDEISSYRLEFVDYGKTDNIIKWNQIDIPITDGEDVVIRVRYKLNIGQPFVDIFTPWSDEIVVTFPPEYNDDVEVRSIVDTNKQDTVTAGFRKILIDEGYEEHVQNKSVSSDQIFFHQPENIYSGFNTSENNLISLKDKLISMVNDIEKYKVMIDNATNSKFEVYLEYDGQNVLLSPNIINKINIYNSDHISGNFIKKNMNLIIKNTGDVRLNLYSIFPGNTQIPLLLSDIEFYNETIVNYERVPMMVNEEVCPQYLGQWIYFRQTNPYNKNEIYYNDELQNSADLTLAVTPTAAGTYEMIFNGVPASYMSQDNRQILLGYRERGDSSHFYHANLTAVIETLYKMDSILDDFILYKANELVSKKMFLMNEAGQQSIFDLDDSKVTEMQERRKELTASINLIKTPEKLSSEIYKELDIDFFVYKNSTYGGNGEDNKYLMRFEDIQGKNANNQIVKLDNVTPVIDFLTKYKPTGFTQDSDFSGAFFYPNLMNRSQIMTEGGEKDSVYIDVGKSLSLPVVFEYYLDGEAKQSIAKSLYFDIRNSLVSNPLHYMVELTGNYDYSAAGDIYNNFDNVELADNVTM